LWDSEVQPQQHRVRRDVINDTGNIEMSSSAMLATDNIVTQGDDESSFYDYYSNVYDETAYDDYQFHSGLSDYNKVCHCV